MARKHTDEELAGALREWAKRVSRTPADWFRAAARRIDELAAEVARLERRVETLEHDNDALGYELQEMDERRSSEPV